VVQLGNQDFISGLKYPADSFAECKIERSHILPERNSIHAFSTQKGSHLFTDSSDHFISFLRGNKMTMGIGI